MTCPPDQTSKHPDFEPGNQVVATHGLFVADRADQVSLADLLSERGWPDTATDFRLLLLETDLCTVTLLAAMVIYGFGAPARDVLRCLGHGRRDERVGDVDCPSAS